MQRCVKCGLSNVSRQEVIGRGSIPAKVLFIGEAPGLSEDVQGKPFCGPSGVILGQAILTAAKLVKLTHIPSYYMTNVVRCRPIDKDGNNRTPTYEEAWACFPNLEQVYLDVEPKEVIFLGKVVKDYCLKAWPHGVALDHPAYLLRIGGTESPEYIRFVRNLSEVFRRVSNGKAS